MTPSPLPENRVRALNDAFRTGGPSSGGRWVLTQGVLALGPELVASAVGNVRTFDQFDSDNDPWGEHDFGSFSLGGEKLFWKIDYYDADLKHGSEDPTNPVITTRVLTIMLAEEY